MRRACTSLCAVVITGSVFGGGCGRTRHHAIAGAALTIYAAAPMEGATAARGRDVLDGERLALEAVRGRVGGFRVHFTPLDDAGVGQPDSQPARVSQNARVAVSDPTAIAYLGEPDPGASAISIPITNRAGLMQISPTDTLPGLTRREGAAPGEPDKYYPALTRTFGRVIASDDHQADVLVSYMHALGVRRLALLDDEGPDTRSITRTVATLAPQRGVAVGLRSTFDTRPPKPRDFAAEVSAARVDGLLLAVGDQATAAALAQAVQAVRPSLKLFVPGVLADPSFARRLGPAEGSAFAVSPVLVDPASLRRQSRFKTAFQRRYGRPAGPWAAYGYEAMSVVLETIRVAGVHARDRLAVLRRFFATSDRRSVLGTYSIDANGDTTLTDYGAYRLRGGAMTFDRVLHAGR